MVKIEITADSGAGETVGPKTIAPHIPISPSKGSIAGVGCVAADGTKISEHGERMLIGVDNEGMAMGMKMQVADVSKLLAAVSSICDAGNRVIFDNEGSYIESKKTGKKTVMRRENGVYKFDLWMQQNQSNNGVNSVFTRPVSVF